MAAGGPSMAMLSELLENGGELAYEHLIALDATIQREGLNYAIVRSFKRFRFARHVSATAPQLAQGTPPHTSRHTHTSSRPWVEGACGQRCVLHCHANQRTRASLSHLTLVRVRVRMRWALWQRRTPPPGAESPRRPPSRSDGSGATTDPATGLPIMPSALEQLLGPDFEGSSSRQHQEQQEEQERDEEEEEEEEEDADSCPV
eukprot:COSAG05_NODE_1815_length_4034_cov_1.658958_4_plen_202_part_01